MLRIRKTTIKLTIEREFAEGGLADAIESVKSLVSEGLDTLSVVAPKFDEVRQDKYGNVHCKNLAASPKKAN